LIASAAAAVIRRVDWLNSAPGPRSGEPACVAQGRAPLLIRRSSTPAVKCGTCETGRTLERWRSFVGPSGMMGRSIVSRWPRTGTSHLAGDLDGTAWMDGLGSTSHGRTVRKCVGCVSLEEPTADQRHGGTVARVRGSALSRHLSQWALFVPPSCNRTWEATTFRP
jgi:hypothetical protein